jgi:predicted ATPase
VDASSGSYSLVLTPDWDQTQNVNLVDTGTGVAQVLPIFVQRAIDELGQNTSNESRIEIVEQPELHLHPSAHAQLADLYVGVSVSILLDSSSKPTVKPSFCS